jgi:hypothetical protein
MNTELALNVTKIVYDVISQTKKRLPLFIIGLHVFIANNLFTGTPQKESMDKKVDEKEKLNIYIYLGILSIICLLWEFFFAIKATIVVHFPWYSEMSFALYVSITRFVNLIVVCMFVTQGNPLTHIVPLSQEFLTAIMSVIIVVNYFIDKFESKHWNANWKKMYEIRNKTIERSKNISELDEKNEESNEKTNKETDEENNFPKNFRKASQSINNVIL